MVAVRRRAEHSELCRDGDVIGTQHRRIDQRELGLGRSQLDGVAAELDGRNVVEVGGGGGGGRWRRRAGGRRRQLDVDARAGSEAGQREVRAVDERERDADQLGGDVLPGTEAPRERVDGKRGDELEEVGVGVVGGQQGSREVDARAETAGVVVTDVETSHAAAPAVKVARVERHRLLVRHFRLTHTQRVAVVRFLIRNQLTTVATPYLSCSQ